MKKLLLFLVRLLVISLLFIPALPSLHYSYKFALALITTGGMPTSAVVDALNFDAAGNLYTFLVLLLAIPGMEIRKRALGVAIGITLFLCADSFMTAIWMPHLKVHRQTIVYMAVTYGWIVVAHYLLPFLLWIVLAYRQIEEMCKREMIAEGR